MVMPRRYNYGIEFLKTVNLFFDIQLLGYLPNFLQSFRVFQRLKSKSEPSNSLPPLTPALPSYCIA
jgi:hypothetical protein